VRRPRPGTAAAGVVLAAAAGLYVIAAWQSKPGFYDGFAPPADTYRWVKAPDGVTSNGLMPLPGAASLLVSTDHTRVAAGMVATGETPPQARLEVPAGAFNAPASDMVAVDVTPMAAPSRPDNAVIVGNLYCVTATASLTPGATLKLTLTYSSQLPGADAIFRYYDETLSWSRLPATVDGRMSTVSASIPSLGCYAPASVAAVAPAAAASSRGTGNRLLPLVAGGSIVLVLVASLPLYLRVRRERRLQNRT
jgi:hypothetical protein